MELFFDNLAADWDDGGDGQRTNRERVAALLEPLEGKVVADIGCGRGVLFPHLLVKNPRKIYGIDLSGEMLRFARRDFPDTRIELLQSDFLTAELPPPDAAVIFNAYPHFMEKDALVKKLAACLAPGAPLVIAHGLSRAAINGRHRDVGASPLSVPLWPAEEEARRFGPDFAAEVVIDDADFYCIKFVRV